MGIYDATEKYSPESFRLNIGNRRIENTNSIAQHSKLVIVVSLVHE